MNILFLTPPSPKNIRLFRSIDCSMNTKAAYLWQPYDYLIISSYAKEDDKVSFLDGTVDSLSKDEFLKKLIELKKTNWDVVISCTGSGAYHEDIPILLEIRKIFFNSTICVLGDVFIDKWFIEDILNKDFDGIIYNPYHINLNQISKIREKKLNNNKSKFDIDSVITEPIDHPFLKDLKKKKVTVVDANAPRHEVFQNKGYSWPFNTKKHYTTVTTMWGCTYSCDYCNSGRMHPIAKTNENIIKEFEYLNEKGFKEIQFSDKVFGVPKVERKELLKKIIEKNLAISFSCYFHPSMYDEELLELMKKAKCHTIVIGIDSANLKDLALHNRKVNENTLHKLIDKANELKINVCGDFILGLPHETEEDILKTIEYSKKLKIDFASFNVFALAPGSPDRTKAIQEGKIPENACEETLSNVTSSKHVSGDRLIELRRKANREFYFRPWMFFRRISRLQSIEHLMIQLNQMVGIIRNNIV